MPDEAEEHPERESDPQPRSTAIDEIAPVVWWALEAVALYLECTGHEGLSWSAKALVVGGRLAVELWQAKATK
ncbi:hypothetical protein COUCH_37885 [Couchioplanes caeruleus]|uniref:hypothetical protein n=1 Tax=Couchioplanes caeruleus TaxID=56438 RepID=UPI0020BE2B73|nr:hypothetical protein [Couchioplanes caeruleus]UQU64646.1 hypothetical protein COUCH_37885 [Couchioplanes caeruleus]